jgi:hypothetical protein
MAIIHCFSCRLYGLRNYTKQIKNILNNPSQVNLELDKKNTVLGRNALIYKN